MSTSLVPATGRLPLPQELARRDLERLQRYARLLEFYHGRQWEGAAGRSRRLTFNYARVIIEKVTSYLMTGMSFSVVPVDGSAEAVERARRAEAALREVSDANHLEQLDFETEVDAAVLGDGCYKVLWDPEEGRVRVTAPDVQGIYAWWWGDDLGRLWRVASRYRLERETAEELLGRSLRSSGSAVVRMGQAPEVVVTEAWTEASFQLWVEQELVEERENPYGFIPYVLFPNLRAAKEFWGLSDLPPIMEPVRELNRAFTQLSLILELSGNPIAVLENVEESRDIAVQPGAVWELPERARAYLLDLLQGGGVRLHTDYIELLYRALHDLAEAPRTSFGDNPRALSGVALEMELHPLLQKVRRKRLIRTAVYRRRNELILRLLERFAGLPTAPYRTQVHWGAILPQDRGRLVEDERTLVEAGLHSRRRAMAELGVEDPEGELERWLEEERRMADRG